MGFRRSPEGARNARRAVLGSFLLIAGFVVAGLIGTGRVHRALTQSQPEIRSTCVELLTSNLEGSAVVRLSDANVVMPPQWNASHQTDGPQSAVTTWIDKIASDPRANIVLDHFVRGEVFPRGVSSKGSPSPLRLGFGRSLAKLAQTEVNGAIDGWPVHVSRDRSASYLMTAAEWCEAKTGYSIPLPNGVKQDAKLPIYRVHPLSTIESPMQASVWLFGGILTMAIGWVCCGSAGLGRWFLLCPVGGVLGLPGVGLRCGRGGWKSRLLYRIAGFALIFAGVYATETLGGIRSDTSLWLWQVCGVVVLSAGIAAVLGATISKRRPAANLTQTDSLESLSKLTSQRGRGLSKAIKDSKRSGSAMPSMPAAAMGLSEPSDYTRRYHDPRLSVSCSAPGDAEAHKQTVALEKCEFEQALWIEINRFDGASKATIQVGCQDLVMAMTDQRDEVLRHRLVSVLENGRMLVSMDDQDDQFTESMANDAIDVKVASMSKIETMLSSHLKWVAKEGKQADSSAATLESAEWRDLVHCSERALAALLHDEGWQKWEIEAARYGRFHFPPQPVTQPELCEA